MITPFDDYPIHQTPLPLAQPGGGHPDHYDRFWFNGYRQDLYFAVALGTYPNRGVIDAAFSVVKEGVQRSVFASGRMPVDPTDTRIGPIRIEITEPLRVNRVVIDGANGLGADITYRARTAGYEEPRQTRYQGARLSMDVTRLTQWGTWTGTVETGAGTVDLGSETTYATKDRSWGIRPVGSPVAAAPSREVPQIFFLWAPINFADECLHFMVFEDGDGRRWSETAAVLPVLGAEAPVFGPGTEADRLDRVEHHVRWAPGLRRSDGASLVVMREGRWIDTVELEPTLTFRMRGAGYMHPTWGHGRWHDELAVGSEEHRVDELDSLDPTCVHVQQVMRARWGDRTGLGVLEQLVFGPHAPSGFADLLDGAAAGAST